MSMKKSLLLLSFAAVFVLGGCTATTDTTGATNTTTVSAMHQQPTSVKVARRDLVGYELLDAGVYLPADAIATVLPPYNAPVEKLYVAAGDHVRKGAPILKMSFTNAQASYD